MSEATVPSPASPEQFPYLRGETDVIEIVRAPEPGGAGGAYRAFGATLRGLKTTLARVIEGTSNQSRGPAGRTSGIPSSHRSAVSRFPW